MSTLLPLPVGFSYPTCPTCQRPCGEDELSECLRCGKQYCQQDDWSESCPCDLIKQTAHEIEQRMFSAYLYDRSKQ
jgi:hypothetical protein